VLPFNLPIPVDPHYVAAAACGYGVPALIRALRRAGRARNPFWILVARPAWRVGAWIIGPPDVAERGRDFRERLFCLWERYLLERAIEAVARSSARGTKRVGR
jgi:hypothetical protein